MKKLSKERVGELNLLGTAVLWSFFPIISILIISGLAPLAAAAVSTFFSTFFFLLIMIKKRLFAELKIKEAWPDILKATFIIGFLVYFFIFIGLKFTSAGNMIIISQSESLFAIFIMYYWKGEKLTRPQLYGALLMLLGVGLVLYNGAFELNRGDVLVLLAAAVAPVGNYYAKRVMRLVSSHTLMFVRSIISFILLFFSALLLEGMPSFSAIEASLLFLLINGFLLLGYSKHLWLEGLRRLSVSKATAMMPIIPAFTLLFAIPILGQIPTIYHLLGLVIIIFGLYLITFNNGKLPKTT